MDSRLSALRRPPIERSALVAMHAAVSLLQAMLPKLDVETPLERACERGLQDLQFAIDQAEARARQRG